MRASRSATVSVVTKGVDVEGTLGVGVAALEVPGHLGGGALAFLLKDDVPGDLDSRVGVGTEDGDCG